MSSLVIRNKTIHISYVRNRVLYRKTLKLPDTNEGWKKAKEFQRKLDAEILLEHIDQITNPKKVILLSEGFNKFGKNGIYEIVYKYLKEITGNIPVNLILRDHIDRLRQTLEGKKHNTLVSYFNHLRVMFNYFKTEGYININPIPKLRWELKQVITIPENELKLIIDNLEPEIGNLVKLMALTGLRVSEALAFKKEDINWNDNVIEIRNTKAKRLEQFPIYPELKAFLIDNGEWYHTDRYYPLKAFQKVCKELNLKKYKLHDLRRTFASRYASVLTPIELQKLTRHKDIKTTLNSYISLDMNSIGQKM